MQCPNCGAENNPKDRFCSLCGEVLKTEQADYTDENRAAQVSDDAQAAPVVVNEISKMPEPKRNRRAIIIGIVIALAVMGVVALAYQYILSQRLTPEQRLSNGVLMAGAAERGLVTTTVTLEALELPPGLLNENVPVDYLADAGLESHSYYDLGEGRFEGTTDLVYLGLDIVSFDWYVDDTYVLIDSSILYNDPLYISYEDLYALSINPMLRQVVVSMMARGNSSAANGFIPSQEAPEPDMVAKTIETMFGLLDRDHYPSLENVPPEAYRDRMAQYFEETLYEYVEASVGIEHEPLMHYHQRYDRRLEEYLMEDAFAMLAREPAFVAAIREAVDYVVDAAIRDRNYLIYGLIMEEGSMPDAWEEDFTQRLNNNREALYARYTEYFSDVEATMDGVYDSLYDSYGSDFEAYSDDVQMDLTWVLDEEDHLLSRNAQVTYDLSRLVGTESHLKLNVDSAFDHSLELIEFQGVERQGAVDVGQLALDELIGLATEITENVSAYLFDNPMMDGLGQ